jgi:hypothetical protein
MLNVFERIESVSVARELRPTRIAFLVDPPTIPPRSTGREHGVCAVGRRALSDRARDASPALAVGPLPRGDLPSARDIVTGNLTTYDPDWIVPFLDVALRDLSHRR